MKEKANIPEKVKLIRQIFKDTNTCTDFWDKTTIVIGTDIDFHIVKVENFLKKHSKKQWSDVLSMEDNIRNIYGEEKVEMFRKLLNID
jgi:hypothetical protein